MAKGGVVPSASHLTENVPGPARKDRFRLGTLPGAASALLQKRAEENAACWSEGGPKQHSRENPNRPLFTVFVTKSVTGSL